MVCFHRRNDDVTAVVLQARTHETGTTEGRHARRAVCFQAQRRQQRGVHRRPVLRVDVQRVLQVVSCRILLNYTDKHNIIVIVC